MRGRRGVKEGGRMGDGHPYQRRRRMAKVFADLVLSGFYRGKLLRLLRLAGRFDAGSLKKEIPLRTSALESIELLKREYSSSRLEVRRE